MGENSTSTSEAPLADLSHWAMFGAGIAESDESGVVCIDLHRDNLGRLPKFGNIVILDTGPDGFVKINYPRDWDLLPTALMALLPDLQPAEAAAFRFGYIHYGGPVSARIFDSLRRDYCYRALAEDRRFRYSLQDHVDAYAVTLKELKAQQASWTVLRDKVPLCRIDAIGVNEENDLGSLTYWRSERPRRGLAPGRLEDELHYKKHLVAAYRWGNALYMFEALVNLIDLYLNRKDWIRGLGLSRYCSTLWDRIGATLPPALRSSIRRANQLCEAEAPEQVHRQVSVLPLSMEAFQYLWLLDDCSVGVYGLLLETPEESCGSHG